MQRFGQIYAVRICEVTYVGKAIGSALGRWSGHIRLLKGGIHHCKALQDAFNYSGITGITFSIIKDKVPEEFLTHEEVFYTKELGGVNALPGHVVREQKARQILDDIKSGIKYRDIVASHGVSLGYVARVKAMTHT